MESNPNGLIVCGGDLNRLDLEKLTAVSGLKVLVDFATRGSAILDNCLTNNESLFSKCYPIIAQIKTDHKGIVLPPGAKLKPVRFKYILCDYREHRMNKFHQELLEHDWNNVNRCTNVDSAAECLQSDLRRLMAQCFPAKTVRMSSRDPPWISPLEADLQVLKLKINNLSCNNRKTLASGEKGSRSWWRKVDLLTRRKDKTDLSLDKDFVQTLNLYFGNLCYDEHYIKPTTMEIDDATSAPQLTLTQVFYTLTKIKKTATGPDGIPFWVWKDFAAIPSPVVMNIWNTSLLTQRWPWSWKEANVSPLPKVVTPVNAADFRGISVTSVIARAFERVVYSTFCKEDIEKYLGPDQFAYRSGGSCTNALVIMQRQVACCIR